MLSNLLFKRQISPLRIDRLFIEKKRKKEFCPVSVNMVQGDSKLSEPVPVSIELPHIVLIPPFENSSD